MNNLTIIPIATEKVYGQVTVNNTYAFSVPLSANKQQITDAVEAQFAVKVTNIKTLVQNGKAIRYNRGKNRYPGSTVRSDSKKAYVTLAKGDSIKVFDTTTEKKEETK